MQRRRQGGEETGDGEEMGGRHRGTRWAEGAQTGWGTSHGLYRPAANAAPRSRPGPGPRPAPRALPASGAQNGKRTAVSIFIPIHPENGSTIQWDSI